MHVIVCQKRQGSINFYAVNNLSTDQDAGLICAFVVCFLHGNTGQNTPKSCVKLETILKSSDLKIGTIILNHELTRKADRIGRFMFIYALTGISILLTYTHI